MTEKENGFQLPDDDDENNSVRQKYLIHSQTRNFLQRQVQILQKKKNS
jgi:hypothetical protein